MNGTTMERMIPTTAPTTQAVKAVQAAIKSIDRKAIRRQLDEAIERRRQRLEELDQEIRQAELDLQACEYLRLKNKVDNLHRDRADTEGNLNGEIHSLQKRLSRDAESDKKLLARIEQVDLLIHRNCEAIRNTRYENPNRANDAAQRLQALFAARQRLAEVLTAADPHKEIENIIATFKIEE
jgi:paraquat-inducible protein B